MEQIPKELQINPLSYPSSENFGEEIFRVIRQVQSGISSELPIDREMLQNITNALVVFANQSWRITGAITDPDSKEPKSELSTQDVRRLVNILEIMTETLTGIGFKVIDRVGEPFNAGMPEQIVTEEAREGIIEERIIRTVQPTVMWNQTMVQRGAIDIAFPKK